VSSVLLLVCFLVIVSQARPPRSVYPNGLFDVGIAVAAPNTAGATILTPVISGRLDERFVVAWPKSLRVGVPDDAIVRIAANKYEDLLKDIEESNRRIKQEHFKGLPRLEVTLAGDSGVEIIARHNDEQVLVKGQKHKEWSWSILPKATGPHQLILRVYGVQGNIHEDYDPEVEQYEVAFNFWYWLSNGVQQNAIGFISALILALCTFFLGLLRGERKGKREVPESAKPDP
jgi:hypothetical protein